MMPSLPLRATLVAVLALLAGATALVLVIGWQANRALSARTLADLADDIADLTEAHAIGGLAALERRIAARLAHDGRETRILHLVTADGRNLGGTFKSGGNINVDDLARGPVFSYRSPREPISRLAVGRIVMLPASAATLVVARDIEDQRALARRIQVIALAGLAVLAAASLVFGFLARRRLLVRMSTITRTAHAIMSGDLGKRIPTDATGDEFDTLAINLNSMLARIDSLVQALREVSDNIAHDLKTPINRLRNTAEAALAVAERGHDAAKIATLPNSAPLSPSTPVPRSGRDDDRQLRAALGSIIEQADGIIQTFNALLQVARLEQGASETPLETIDLGALVMDVADLYAPVAEDANLLIRVLEAPETLLRANRQLIGQALANLLDNAIKYSAGHNEPVVKPIELTLVSTAAHVEIMIADRGPGIAPDDRATALRRFGRLDKSRSQPGTGLGLSLVSAIARLHGGTLRLDDHAPGLKVILTLPRSPSGGPPPTVEAAAAAVLN